MPITHQASFGAVGTVHASDSLKHERGVSRLGGGPGPWRDQRSLRGRPGGGRVGQAHSGQTSSSSKPKKTQPAQSHRAWVCGFVGVCFVSLEDFFPFGSAQSLWCTVPNGPARAPGVRLKWGWGVREEELGGGGRSWGREEELEVGEGGKQGGLQWAGSEVRDSHLLGVQESQVGLWGQGDLEVPVFR